MGVFSLISLIIWRLMEIPASWAMAGRWRAELVEQPRAISAVSAFSKDFSVTMSLGRMLSSRSFMTCIPAAFARRIRSP